jgi:hypothetical protein
MSKHEERERERHHGEQHGQYRGYAQEEVIELLLCEFPQHDALKVFAPRTRGAGTNRHRRGRVSVKQITSRAQQPIVRHIPPSDILKRLAQAQVP